SPLTYSEEGLRAAERGIDRLRAAVETAPPATPTNDRQLVAELAEATARARLSFTAAMEDDFNTPAAIAAMFDLVREINRAREQGVGGEALADSLATLRELTGVLGFTLQPRESEDAVAAQPFIEL